MQFVATFSYLVGHSLRCPNVKKKQPLTIYHTHPSFNDPEEYSFRKMIYRLENTALIPYGIQI